MSKKITRITKKGKIMSCNDCIYKLCKGDIHRRCGIIVENIPSDTEILVISTNYKLTHKIPPSVQKLVFGGGFSRKINSGDVPSHIRELSFLFPHCAKIKTNVLGENLKILKINSRQLFTNDMIPNSVEHLILSSGEYSKGMFLSTIAKDFKFSEKLKFLHLYFFDISSICEENIQHELEELHIYTIDEKNYLNSKHYLNSNDNLCINFGVKNLYIHCNITNVQSFNLPIALLNLYLDKKLNLNIDENKLKLPFGTSLLYI